MMTVYGYAGVSTDGQTLEARVAERRQGQRRQFETKAVAVEDAYQTAIIPDTGVNDEEAELTDDQVEKLTVGGDLYRGLRQQWPRWRNGADGQGRNRHNQISGIDN
jgi:hypothetical protein